MRHFLLALLILLPMHGHATDSDDSASAGVASAPATEPFSTQAPESAPDPRPHVEVLYELDAYYSSVDLSVPLTSEPVPDGGAMRERDVYRHLLLHSWRPRVLLLEASVYPLPAFGTWLHSRRPKIYDDLEVGEAGDNQLNIMEALTAGYQEPWAVSAFLGSEMRFSREGRRSVDRTTNNRAYMGYLVSCGAKHIRQNVLIDDNWCEVEWKLKGERHRYEEILNWSFRIGLKEHGNPDIADVNFISLRRDNLDFRSEALSYLKNTRMELMAEFDNEDFRLLRWELTVGKKLPMPSLRWALGLDVGFIAEDGDKYTGELYDPTVDRFTIVFRPNIEF